MRWSNDTHRSPFAAREIESGTLRPKRSGEHIIYTDRNQLGEDNYRSENLYRACQRRIWDMIRQPAVVSTAICISKFSQKTSITSLSPLTKLSGEHFRITRGVSLDGYVNENVIYVLYADTGIHTACTSC